jgi:rhamnopyranosyl-N-acetylglucosaminyl-diphospho-decaprenol beta-1,3/1,4-galactofuranosyltransferase
MARDGGEPTVCAVVVTYNRRDLLEECLTALQGQSRPLDGILVVDNASTDGTDRLLTEKFPSVTTLRLASNLGGAGGFTEGVKRAYADGFDWLWLMDDDTIPTESALEELLAVDRRDGLRPPSILASKVLDAEGNVHPFNRPWPRTGAFAELVDAAASGLLLIRYASFVSLMIRRDAVQRHGLPHAEYFIWNDDVEYTARVLRDEPGYLVPASVVHHKNVVGIAGAATATDRYYYEVRNKLFLLRSQAWKSDERMERLRIVLGIVSGALWFLSTNRYRPWALRTLAKGVRDGLSALPPTRFPQPR